MKISILGLGWLGLPLGISLKEHGHEILGTTRASEKLQEISFQGLKGFVLNYPDLPDREILKSDVLIINIPPFKEELSWFKSWKIPETTWIIFISSTSVISTPDSDNALILKSEEEWVKTQVDKWTIIRFGGLIGKGRHPSKYLSGKKNLPGKNWPVNLIHLDDCIGLIHSIIENKLIHKVWEAVSPEHPMREEYYLDSCAKLSLPLPEFNQNDESRKEEIHSEEVRNFYKFQRSLFL